MQSLLRKGRKRKRRLVWSPTDSTYDAAKSKRQRLEHTEDKPLRYMFIFTHTLIANYEEIMKDSWSRAIKYVLARLNRDTKYPELRMSVTQYLNGMTISHIIEDDLVDQLFRFMTISSLQCPELSETLKYDLMEIKNKFFDDNMHRIQLKPGIRIMLRELRETLKWTLCLIHKDSRETFNLILNDIGLRGYFNAFVCANSVSNHRRPYSQIYEQAILRSRIFKQQCLILTEHIPEALEHIEFGLYPILVSNQRPIMDGEYFLIQKSKHWMDEVQKLAVSIRATKEETSGCGMSRIYAMPTFRDYHSCFDEGDKVKFMEPDGKVFDAKIDKLFNFRPIKLYKLRYTDESGKTKTALKQTYFIWREEEQRNGRAQSLPAMQTK